MSFLDSIKNQSKKHELPFNHWEYNNALSDGAIDEIIKASQVFSAAFVALMVSGALPTIRSA